MYNSRFGDVVGGIKIQNPKVQTNRRDWLIHINLFSWQTIEMKAQTNK